MVTELSTKSFGFKVISECPCATCTLRLKDVSYPLCVHCSSTNNWANYRKNTQTEFDTDEKKKYSYKIFSLEELDKELGD